MVKMLISKLTITCCLPIIFILFCSTEIAFSYKPVIIVHGLFDKASDLDDLSGFITKVRQNKYFVVNAFLASGGQ